MLSASASAKRYLVRIFLVLSVNCSALSVDWLINWTLNGVGMALSDACGDVWELSAGSHTRSNVFGPVFTMF